MSHCEHEPTTLPGRSDGDPRRCGDAVHLCLSPRGQSGGQGCRKRKVGYTGAYPGIVVEVRHPRMIRNDIKNREAIRDSVARGMKELTGATDSVAWVYLT